MPYSSRPPARELVLAIDIGTTSMKGGLISPEGTLLGEHRVIYREKGSADYHSWDARVWIESLRDIVATLGGYERIRAVCVSGQGPTVVPVGEDGLPLYYALLWLDSRALHRPGTASYFLPKIAWFRSHCPELYARTQWFLSCPEYINFFLTGKAATVAPHEDFRPYFWSSDELGLFDIDMEKLPPFRFTAQILGEVTAGAAEQTGIPPGVPVVAGGSDFLMALLGSGTVEPGRVCDRAGTSEGVNLCADRPLTHPRLRVLPHVLRGLYNASGILSSTGRLFEWLRQITGQTERTYREVLQELENLPLDRSRPMFFPGQGDPADMQFGDGAFLDLRPEHDRRDLGRAIVESIGFGIRRILSAFEEVGYPCPELRVTGGQARNVIWNQMKADMTGRVVVVPEIEDAELLGCGICALVALGDLDRLDEASRALTRVRARFTPRERHARFYDGEYQRYWEKCLTFRACAFESLEGPSQGLEREGRDEKKPRP